MAPKTPAQRAVGSAGCCFSGLFWVSPKKQTTAGRVKPGYAKAGFVSLILGILDI